VEVRPDARSSADAWYWKVPAVAAVRDGGLTLDTPMTVLVGENGSGKSTLLEAVAFAWHSRLTAQVHHWGPQPSAEDTDLYWTLKLTGEHPPPQGGCFLRAEAMHLHFGRVDAEAAELRAFDGQPLNTRSHGESFLAFLESRRDERGLYLLDEPEAALSFRSCFALLYLLGDAVAAGSQVILATHSPLLAAFPGATILELGPDGATRREWAELDLVRDWQEFFAAPDRWLRHLAD
jgi:predicted ATPase